MLVAVANLTKASSVIALHDISTVSSKLVVSQLLASCKLSRTRWFLQLMNPYVGLRSVCEEFLLPYHPSTDSFFLVLFNFFRWDSVVVSETSETLLVECNEDNILISFSSYKQFERNLNKQFVKKFQRTVCTKFSTYSL